MALTDCCGARIRSWHSQGDSVADQGTCRDCDAELCSHCAGVFESEGGYGDDGQGVRTFALCSSCKPERDRVSRSKMHDWRKDPRA